MFLTRFQPPGISAPISPLGCCWPYWMFSPPYSNVVVSFGDSSSCAQEMVLTATSLKMKNKKKLPDESPPELFLRPKPTSLYGVPEQAYWKIFGDEMSMLRVIENGLNVTFPAPAPELWEPMLRTCS